MWGPGSKVARTLSKGVGNSKMAALLPPFRRYLRIVGNIANLAEDQIEELNEPRPVDVAKAVQKLTLTHTEASQNLRLTEALAYPPIHGPSSPQQTHLAHGRKRMFSRFLQALGGRPKPRHRRQICPHCRGKTEPCLCKDRRDDPSVRGDTRTKHDFRRVDALTNDTRSSQAARSNACLL